MGMNKVIFLMFCFWSGSCQLLADDFKENEERRLFGLPLSDKYLQGPFLIYDCEQQFFVCAGPKNAAFCAQTRSAYLKSGETNLPCAVLKKFPFTVDCLKEQNTQVNRPGVKKFCLNEI